VETAVSIVSLERVTGRLNMGYDVWDCRGRLILRTLAISKVLRRRASYFRVNQTGKIYQLESRHKSIEIPRGAIEWR
jgi:hypothetical protein